MKGSRCHCRDSNRDPPQCEFRGVPLCYLLSKLTSCGWVPLQKPPVLQLLRNFEEFYGTQRFITVFTRALHRSLSWARYIQSIAPHPISLRSILILSIHLRLGLPSVLFPSGLLSGLLLRGYGRQNRKLTSHFDPLSRLIRCRDLFPSSQHVFME
jgi:hypothetical protein